MTMGPQTQRALQTVDWNSWIEEGETTSQAGEPKPRTVLQQETSVTITHTDPKVLDAIRNVAKLAGCTIVGPDKARSA